MSAQYTEENIRTLDWREHIRRRPGMYIGKLGDGSSRDDGVYILLKEVLDNSVDEFMMGFGKTIEVEIHEKRVSVRDYGRGIPLGKMVEAASKMNTGAKYDSKAFKKSVGLNGVGIKAVNALSSKFDIQSIREGMMKSAEFAGGELLEKAKDSKTELAKGTIVSWVPDKELFGNFHYILEYIEILVKNYTYLNSGLTITLNGEKFQSKRGLLDLLDENMSSDGLYESIYLVNHDMELAMTHGNQYTDEYFAFVNGQHTTQGGTHLAAFKESLVKTIREFYKKDFDPSDIRQSIIVALSLKIEEPIFESQTKTKLGSKDMGPNGPSVRNYINDFLKKHLDDYLHKHPETADILLKKIIESEKERKAISGIKKLARERAKKASLHNKKLRDCRPITIPIMSVDWIPPFLLQKVIQPADPLQNPGRLLPRPFSV
jgi:topoisomerase-4 subunit B